MPSIARELRIPYAIDLDSNCTINADEIQGHLQDLRDTLRLEASASKNTSVRSVRMIACPGCSQRVYPRHPTVPHGRYYWSHGPNTAYVCPLEGKTIMGPDKVNALIFTGRQEGQAHKDLILLLKTLAEQDPSTEGSVTLGQYEAPTDAMRAEFPHGRFPDLQFKYKGRRAVLEAQLATITLSGINGRRSFYDRNGACLLWVMRHFEPEMSIRAYMKDIIADQQGVLFSIDDEVARASSEDRVFRLRAWQYEYRDEKHVWTNKVVEFSVALEMATPKRWADDFKRRWREAYAGRSYREASTDPHLFFRRVDEKN